MRTFGWLLLAIGAAACGSSSGGGSSGPAQVDGVTLMAGFNPGPAPSPDAGFQVVLPIVNNIAVGASDEYCTWTNITLDHDVWLKESVGYQTETGHHIIIYYTMTPQPSGQTRLCTDADMVNFRFGVGAGGEGVAEDNKLPGDLAVHIPKGAQLVINHHYLNASARPVAQAQSAVSVFYAPKGSKVTQTSSLAFLDTSMTLPPGNGAVDFSCTMKSDTEIWEILPHMHYYGTHINVDLVGATTTKRLFDLDWNPDYMFHPPITTTDPSQPDVLHAGDQLKVHCEYNNTTSGMLSFGQEMCVVYGQTVDPNMVGNMQCDQGQWGSF